MPPPFRVTSISFHRVTGSGDPLAIPVRTSRSAALQAVDWETVGGAIKSRAVAISRKAPGAITLSVTLDVAHALTDTTRIRATVTGSTIGNVKARSIGTPAAGLLTVDVHVDGPNLLDFPVSDFTFSWDWEFKSGLGPWTRFETTNHRVFVIAGEPVAPWGRPGTPATVVPWDDVMALACSAAAGNKSPESCASAMTRAVFALGTQSIMLSGTAIDIGYSGAANFAGGNGVYFLSDFFLTAKLKPGAATAMNCADLAGAVAILSSAIGCRQVGARLEPKSGSKIQTNPIELFGATTTAKETFEFHEFAATRTPSGDLGNKVWDACFRIDMDSSPTVAPHALDLATALPQQSTLTQRGYLKQALKPASSPSVSAVFGNGVQFPDDLPPGVLMPSDAFLDNKHVELDLLLRVKPDLEKIVNATIVARVHKALTKDAAVIAVRAYTVAAASYPENVMRWPVADGKTIRVSFLTAGPDAKWIFLRRAAMITRPPRPLAQVGDAAILSPENDAVVMKVRDTVVYLVNDSRARDSLVGIATKMAQTLRDVYR